VPAVLAAAESDLKASLQRRLARGRVELMLSVQFKAPGQAEIELNEPVVTALARALERGRAMGLDLAPVTTSDLLRLPQAVVVRERVPGADEAEQASILDLAKDAVEAAADAVYAMRVREGNFLEADLEGRRLGSVGSSTNWRLPLTKGEPQRRRDLRGASPSCRSRPPSSPP